MDFLFDYQEFIKKLKFYDSGYESKQLYFALARIEKYNAVFGGNKAVRLRFEFCHKSPKVTIMKLLIITQKVDIEDDIKGFFHRWIEKFSEKLDFLNVICLQSGKYSLPSNVKVFSLGKENGLSKIGQLRLFCSHIWQLRKDYDAVFVHMNPVYVVLAGIFWKLWQKKIYLWHNHKDGNLITGLAIKFSDAVFYTSPHSFSARFKKSKIMPVGIDTERFKIQDSRFKIQDSILYLGRFSSVKNVDVLIEAANLLDKEGVNFILNIVGQPGEDEKEYFQKIKNLSEDLEAKGKIRFLGKFANYETPKIYNQNDIFVNLTQGGSFDKTTLEAMACQSVILVSNPVFEGIFPKELQEILIFKEKDPGDLARKLLYLMKLPEEEKEKLGEKLREIVVKYHSLDNLVDKLTHEFNQK